MVTVLVPAGGSTNIHTSLSNTVPAFRALIFVRFDEPYVMADTAAPAFLTVTPTNINRFAALVVTWVHDSAVETLFEEARSMARPAGKVPPPDAPAKVTPAGRVSLTTMLLAVDGPEFVTAMV